MLVKAVNIGYTKQAPLVHGRREVKAVARVEWGLAFLTHSIIITGCPQLTVILLPSIVNEASHCRR
jgi:hypothetical protein